MTVNRTPYFGDVHYDGA